MSYSPHRDRIMVPELDELDEDEREPREKPDAAIMCGFCARVLDDCECVIESQVRCGHCLGVVRESVGSDGLPRYRCDVHGPNVRVRSCNVHYPKGWEPFADLNEPTYDALFDAD